MRAPPLLVRASSSSSAETAHPQHIAILNSIDRYFSTVSSPLARPVCSEACTASAACQSHNSFTRRSMAAHAAWYALHQTSLDNIDLLYYASQALVDGATLRAAQPCRPQQELEISCINLVRLEPAWRTCSTACYVLLAQSACVWHAPCI